MIRALALMILADLVGLMVVGAIILLVAAGWQFLTGGIQ
jgi:uncharacterized membrane protein